MPDVYQQVTNEETEEVSYELVAPENVLEHVGDDLIRTSPLVTEVKDESIKRRKTIKGLKAEMTGLREALDAAQGSDEPDNEEDDEDPPDPQQPEQLSFTSREDLVTYVMSQLDEKEIREAAERATVTEELDALATEHKLSTEDRSMLNGANDPATLADYLGRIRVRFGDVPGGELQPTDDMVSLMGKVNELLGLPD